MKRAGPSLASLLQRLRETPPDFLLGPLAEAGGEVDTVALVADLYRAHGDDKAAADVARSVGRLEVNHALFLHLAVWLLHAPELSTSGEPAARLPPPGMLCDAIRGLATHAKARRIPQEPERAEELTRVILGALDLRPAGESESEAKARLGALDSTARAKVLEESRRAHQRAKEVADTMRRKAEEEAASKVSRE